MAGGAGTGGAGRGGGGGGARGCPERPRRPAEGEMNGLLRISEAELHAFVDGELAPPEHAEVAELLAASPTDQALARRVRPPERGGAAERRAASPTDQALAREIRELNEAIRARYGGLLSDAAPRA